jgi:hypothetical protein
MFADLPACIVGDDAIKALVAWMGNEQDNKSTDNLRVPAGFTYLGQFVDHDITFDPASKLDQQIDPHALVNFRTPRFDLDSLYGAGPVMQPYLYDWDEQSSDPPGAKLLIGHREVDDLPRNQQGRALIGDARNDEHVIISQLHLLFIRFHNAVVDHLAYEGIEAGERLEKAQRIVRWHYQWIVVHEFLRHVAGDEMAKEVLSEPDDGSAPTVQREFFKWEDHPFIPVEFSGAAYRFGHSMVRAEYGLKRLPKDVTGLHKIRLFPELRGRAWLDKDHEIHWERFFRLEHNVEGLRQLQNSQKIDTSMVGPLFELPDKNQELPRLNLLRGRALGLPSGQDVAHAMKLKPLTSSELQLDRVPKKLRKGLHEAAPLWYYILCDSARREDASGDPPKGARLGPVGGRIVAEVLVGLLEGDPDSYLSREPTWRPGELGTGKGFTMAKLVKFAKGA